MTTRVIQNFRSFNLLKLQKLERIIDLSPKGVAEREKETNTHNFFPGALAEPGPPIISDKAILKSLKIWAICSDKISKICPNMFGLNQAFAKFSNFVRMAHLASAI